MNGFCVSGVRKTNIKKERDKMASKLANMHRIHIEKLCYSGEKVIDSEKFRDLQYLVKDNHIVLISGNSGKFALKFEHIPELFKELKEVSEIWGNIKTKKCLL